MLLGLNIQRKLKATTVKNENGPEVRRVPELVPLTAYFQAWSPVYEFLE